MTAADTANLDELHDLIDCIDESMNLSGLDEQHPQGTLGISLLDFFTHHERLVEACEYVVSTRFGNEYGLTAEDRLEALHLAVGHIVDVFRSEKHRHVGPEADCARCGQHAKHSIHSMGLTS